MAGAFFLYLTFGPGDFSPQALDSLSEVGAGKELQILFFKQPERVGLQRTVIFQIQVVPPRQSLINGPNKATLDQA